MRKSSLCGQGTFLRGDVDVAPPGRPSARTGQLFGAELAPLCRLGAMVIRKFSYFRAIGLLGSQSN